MNPYYQPNFFYPFLQIGIAGPNLDVIGALRVARLTLEATVGTMHVNAKIVADRLSLHAQSIVVASEALISTDKLTVRLENLNSTYPPYFCRPFFPKHIFIVSLFVSLFSGVFGTAC